jgi:hypothetical protein
VEPHSGSSIYFERLVNHCQKSLDADTGADGVIDSRWTYSHDAYGNMLSMEHDDDVDGMVDSRTTWTYACS